MNSRGNIYNNNNTRGGASSANINSRPSPHNTQAAQGHNVQGNIPALAPKDQADLDAFRLALKELTFNSRPIIEKLTAMARDRARTIPGPVSRAILDNLVFVKHYINILTIVLIIIFIFRYFPRIIQIIVLVSFFLSIPSSKPATLSPPPSLNMVSSRLTCAFLGKFLRPGMNSRRETFYECCRLGMGLLHLRH